MTYSINFKNEFCLNGKPVENNVDTFEAFNVFNTVDDVVFMSPNKEVLGVFPKAQKGELWKTWAYGDNYWLPIFLNQYKQKNTDTQKYFYSNQFFYLPKKVHSLMSEIIELYLVQEDIGFDDELRQIQFNDKQGSRDRQIRLYIYSKTNIYVFDKGSIEGVVQIKSKDFTKDGKWSNTTYELILAKGFKAVAKRQDWDSGRYIEAFFTPKEVLASLGIEDNVPSKHVNRFLEFYYPHYSKAKAKYWENVETLESRIDTELMPYEFLAKKGTRRQGYLYLVINGEVFYERKESENWIVKSKNGDTYQLMVPSDAEVEELYEYGAYGDDGLEDLGYTLNNDGYYVLDNDNSDDDSTGGNSPFAGLSKMFK